MDFNLVVDFGPDHVTEYVDRAKELKNHVADTSLYGEFTRRELKRDGAKVRIRSYNIEPLSRLIDWILNHYKLSDDFSLELYKVRELPKKAGK